MVDRNRVQSTNNKMASLRKLPNSKYWIACFTDVLGKQRQRSTKIIASKKTRKAALKIAFALEAAHHQQVSNAQLSRLLHNPSSDKVPQEEQGISLDLWLSEWIKLKEGEVSKSTLVKYSDLVSDVREILVSKLTSPLRAISEKDIRDFQAAVLARLSKSTANHRLKMIRMLFSDAQKRQLITSLPTALVKVAPLTEEDETSRRRFRLEELRALLVVVPAEWELLILTGLYTGQRLGDLAAMRWSQIDLLANQIFIKKTRKTKRAIAIPIALPLLKRLQSKAGHPNTPVFAHANELYLQDGSVGRLSIEFRKLLVLAKLAQPYQHGSTGTGRHVKRNTSELSFHSLRHTLTSLLMQTGASRAVAMDIVGHDSAAISEKYTSIEHSEKVAALHRLPDITRSEATPESPAGDESGETTC